MRYPTPTRAAEPRWCSSQEIRKLPAARWLGAATSCGSVFFAPSRSVRTGRGRPMRSILPESNRVVGESSRYRANLMLEEPLLIVRTQRLDVAECTLQVAGWARFSVSGY